MISFNAINVVYPDAPLDLEVLTFCRNESPFGTSLSFVEAIFFIDGIIIFSVAYNFIKVVVVVTVIIDLVSEVFSYDISSILLKMSIGSLNIVDCCIEDCIIVRLAY